MSFPCCFSGPTESYALVEKAVVANFRCFPDYNPHPMINEYALPYHCARVNFNTRQKPVQLAK